MCLTVAVGAIGVPMPVRNVKVSNERFPCENSPCGCADAESCWRDCCCRTNAEKLVWAEKNRVKPPSFVIEAARKEEAKVASLPPCCRQRAVTVASARTCCEKPEASSAACCQDDAESHAPASQHVDARDKGHRIVLLTSALKCRGLSVSLGMLPPALPPTLISFGRPPLLVSDLPKAPSVSYRSPSYDVATPPPDALLASL